jgi:predicted O-methyltransferase YrrM
MFISHQSWATVMEPYRDKPTRYLEIGSFVGESVSWMFQHVLTHPQSRALCIDPWTPYMNHGAELNPTFDLFLKNTEPWHDKLSILRGTSRERILDVPYNSIDIAYVDGDHFQWAALEDLVLVWPRVKVGGLIIADDFGAPMNVSVPKLGIVAFFNTYAPLLELVLEDYQVILRKLK